MDARRNRKQLPSPGSTHDLESEGAGRPESEERPSLVIQKPKVVMAAFILMLLPFIVILSNRSPSLETICKAGRVEETAGYEAKVKQGSENFSIASSNTTERNFLQKNMTKDKFLGGLLVPGFDEGSCLSRYQSVLYRKESPHLPSPHLITRLRKQEALQKKCGPGTKLFSKAIEQMKSGNGTQSSECNYVVVLSYSGLGNKILTLTSAFLYALLTNRVILIDRGAHIADLFCEPFPDTTWLLPWDFPVDRFSSIYKDDPRSYGNMLKDKIIGNGVNGDGANGSQLPPYVYLHLSHDYGDFDKLFYCEDDQRLLQRIQWLLLRSNQYFVPSLFLIPEYEQELGQLFPEKETVFHHLGRYLFHPTNSVWGMIVRSYQAYLAKADEVVGIQVRVFEKGTPFQHVLDQILTCTLEEKVLPNTSLHEPAASSTDARSKVVLVTSLDSAYFERIRSIYWEHPTTTGEIVGVYQPSHEGFEQTGKEMHEMKAWAEIYLLSLTDTLVSSSWSTFGYVARGLGGLKPWIVTFKSANQMSNPPPCRRAMSMDPCFHFPPFLDCKARAKSRIDQGALLPYLRHCEDSGGLKLVGPVGQ